MANIVDLTDRFDKLVGDGKKVAADRKRAAGLSIMDSDGPVRPAPGPLTPPPTFSTPQRPNES